MRAELEAGVFHIVKDAPVFELPSALVIRSDRDRALIDPMVESLRRLAG